MRVTKVFFQFSDRNSEKAHFLLFVSGKIPEISPSPSVGALLWLISDSDVIPLPNKSHIGLTSDSHRTHYGVITKAEGRWFGLFASP